MASSSSSLGSLEKKAKARAFAELFEYISTSLKEGMQPSNWLSYMQSIKSDYKNLMSVVGLIRHE